MRVKLCKKGVVDTYANPSSCSSVKVMVNRELLVNIFFSLRLKGEKGGDPKMFQVLLKSKLPGNTTMTLLQTHKVAKREKTRNY